MNMFICSLCLNIHIYAQYMVVNVSFADVAKYICILFSYYEAYIKWVDVFNITSYQS